MRSRVIGPRVAQQLLFGTTFPLAQHSNREDNPMTTKKPTKIKAKKTVTRAKATKKAAPTVRIVAPMIRTEAPLVRTED